MWLGILAGQTAAELVKLADESCYRRQYVKAIDAYREAMNRIPLGPTALSHPFGQNTQANGMYTSDMHVGVGNALLGLAEQLHAGGDEEGAHHARHQAANEFRQAVMINTKHCQAQYNLGTLLYSLGDVEGAESHLVNAVTWDHHFVEARVNLAVVYAEQGEAAAAKAELRQAINFVPDHVPAHQNMALLMLGNILVEHDPETTRRVALDHLRTVVRLTPESAEAHHMLGAALLHTALRCEVGSRGQRVQVC